MKNLSILMFMIMSFSCFADDFEKEAKKLLKPIKMAFMSELKAGMKQGPYNAIDSCHIKAPHLIELDKSNQYEYGRTSNKIRNSQNEPQEWMQAILNDYINSSADKPMKTKVYKVLANKQVYVEPIYIKPVCMSCHGQIKGSVGKRIKTLYPNDKANQYKVGEFRGLFWVKEK